MPGGKGKKTSSPHLRRPRPLSPLLSDLSRTGEQAPSTLMTMGVVALAVLASLAAAVSPAAAFSSSSYVVGTRTTTALYQYATQAAGLVDVYDIYAPRDVYSMEEWAAQYGMQKVSRETTTLDLSLSSQEAQAERHFPACSRARPVAEHPPPELCMVSLASTDFLCQTFH